MKTGLEQIAEERVKQITQKNYTCSHDQQHKNKELLYAALAYLNSAIYGSNVGEEDWPSNWGEFKSHGYENDLARAGALIAAELDRIHLT